MSFVSVTQHFSTTDSTGRMFLGILITFAQYEREVIGERIRDKVAAANAGENTAEGQRYSVTMSTGKTKSC